jgi:hypothetical protein
MKVQKTKQLKDKAKKITVINIAQRDCRIVAIELNLLEIRLRVGFRLDDAGESPEERNVENIAADARCRDCDIYEGMFW